MDSNEEKESSSNSNNEIIDLKVKPLQQNELFNQETKKFKVHRKQKSALNNKN